MRNTLITIFISVFCQLCFMQNLTGQHLFESRLVKPNSIKQLSNGHYLLDFGKDAFGTVILTLKTPQKDTLCVHLGEKLASREGIDTNPEGTIRYQKITLSGLMANKDYLLCLPAIKRNTNPPAITLPEWFGVIMPFRYCELENLKIPITDVEVQQKIFQSRFRDEASAFTCSDTILNQVWELCKYTIKATSFCGLYIDGDRERTPYEADAYINQLSHYCVDNEFELARKTNEYLMTNPTWPTEWILHTVLLFYNDYMYTGDIQAIAKHYNALKYKTLVDLERTDGLICVKSAAMNDSLMRRIGFQKVKQRIKDIVDWPLSERDGYDMADVNTVVNAFHYINIKLMAELASKLGYQQDALDFHNKSILIQKSFNEKFLSKSSGIYIDGEKSGHSSLHANVFPLVFGLVPTENLKNVITFIKSRGMACGVYGAQYLLEALYQHGEADYALSLMIAKNDRSWWNMIAKGSTITLEAWDIKYKPNLDWNHAWGTAPVNIVTRYLWGITPAVPGFLEVRIAPQLSTLTSSEIKVPTIRGSITASYQGNINQAVYEINLPHGMKGKFVVPAGFTKVLINAKIKPQAIRGIKLYEGQNHIEISR